MSIKKATELLTEFLESELSEWDGFPIEYLDVENCAKYVAVTVELGGFIEATLRFRVEPETGQISVQRGTDGDFHSCNEYSFSCRELWIAIFAESRLRELRIAIFAESRIVE